MGKGAVNKEYTKKEMEKLIKSGGAIAGKGAGGVDVIKINNESFIWDEKKKLFVVVSQEVKPSKEKQSLTKHLEEEHGSLVQKGYTDNHGNWCVTEIITDGVGKKFEIPEECKSWEKKFAYVKFQDDTIIVNEKEEK